ILRGSWAGCSVAAPSVPKVTFVLRRAYGGAYAEMGSEHLGGGLICPWRTARIAVMGAEGAVDLLQRRQIEEAGPVEGPKLRQQLVDMYNEIIATPYTAAERGYIDAEIQPSETRLVLRSALKQLREIGRAH